MPDWVLNLVIPYIMPVIIATLTPILSEYVKKAYEWAAGHLPAPVMLSVATAVAEGANQVMQYLNGHSLPYGMSALVAVFVNTILKAFGTSPATPGVTRKALPEPK